MAYVKLNGLQAEQFAIGNTDSPTNSRSFKELLVDKGVETSSSPGYTNKKRTSKVYHVGSPHILKEREVKTVQFLGGDYIKWTFFFL